MKREVWSLTIGIVLIASQTIAASTVTAERDDNDTVSILVFTKTTGYRHESIPDGVRAIESIAQERNWTVHSTENAEIFTDHGLEDFDVVVFLNTSGDVLDQLQEAAFERFIESGNGFVGVHAAAETEPACAWYQALIGAYAVAHPDVQAATLIVEDDLHPSSADLGRAWEHRDSYYSFDRNPRVHANVVLSVNETTYDPGEEFMGDHPIAWYRRAGRGRAFYTALGHTKSSYREALFVEHLAGAIYWASGPSW